MNNTTAILFFILICFCVDVSAQIDSTVLLNAKIRSDSIRFQRFNDTTATTGLGPRIGGGKAIIAKEQDVDDIIEYGSKDSSELDNTKQIMQLWGEAYVRYQTYTINAHHITIDIKNNIAVAEAGRNEFGRPLGKVDVTIEGERVIADKLTFNFETKKGIIHEGRMKQNDLYINSELIKVISGPYDSIQHDDVAYQKNALITTCNHPEAHFGIQASRMKVVPDRVAIIGPSYVEIGGVPTPLVLPFGFLPMKKGRRTGIMFPNDYTFSPQWGYGLNNIGYYFPISDHYDMTVSGDIYLRGSHRLGVQGRYNTRYKYNGSVQLEYSAFYTEAPSDYKIVKQTSYRILINHRQDPKANPYHNFGGNANIQFGNFRSLNFNDANSVLNNNLSSNLTYRRIFSGKPYSFSAAMNHSQQLTTRDFTLELPTLDFVTQSIFPFKNTKRVGDEKWYEQISFTYNAQLKNKLTAKDTSLFTNQTLRSSKQGVRQAINVTSSYKVLKYLNLSPSFNYNEIWGYNAIHQEFDPTVVYRSDTTWLDPIEKTTVQDIRLVKVSDGRVVKDTVNKFNAFRTYNASLSLNTQLFGLMQFKKGFVRGIRHQMRPNLSMTFAPDYTHLFQEIQTSNDTLIPRSSYSQYQENIYGGPSNSGQQMGLNLSISNSLEAKVMGRKDSVARKIKIFDNFHVGTFYNFAADSLHLSPLTYNATTRLFKGLSTLSLNGGFDFYDRNERGQKIDVFMWESKRKLARFVNFNATLNTSMTMEKIRKFFAGELTESEAHSRDDRVRGALGGQSFWSMLDNFAINHTFSMNIIDNPGPNKINFNTNSLSVSGSMPITEKWAVNVNYMGYDFKRKEIIYPDLGFTRDLHCWQMSMSWQPVRGTYSFIINVKPGTLDFLKIPNNKNRQDVFTNF